MELINEFRVGVPVEEAWVVLTDVERIAPCMPGAQLTEVDGDTYTGNVKVKVGPITALYKGTATFVEKDDVAHKAVLKADGRDTRGQGNASAVVTATLEADGDGTKVTVQTDLTVTGKVAQFGRGVLVDVSSKLVGQFVQCLESDVLTGPPAPSDPSPDAASDGSAHEASGASGASPATEAAGTPVAPAAPLGGPTAAPLVGPAPTSGGSTGASPSAPGSGTTPSGPRKIEAREVAPVDLLGTAGAPVAKRVAPVLGVLVVVLWLLRRRRKP